jgi:pteridine reductase
MDMERKEFPLALVTGAAHRLGRAFALSLAQQGYAILLHYHHSAEKAALAADEMRATGVPVYLLQADLSEAANLDALFDKVDSLPNRLSVLVNSAAIMQRADLRQLSAADWDATLDLNLRAPFLVAQQAAKRMEEGGLIVNVSDAGAARAWTGFPAYSVSKAALESLTRLLAKAYAPEIRVNAIAPGLTLPSESVSQQEWERLVDRLPLKRSVQVEEVVAALEFLLKNGSITGQTIVVDGGYSLL